MAKEFKYDEDQAIRILSKKRDLKIDVNKKTIKIQRDPTRKRNDLGNGSWGKIDFLINHCGFSKS